MAFVHKIANKIGIDKAIFFTLLGRGLQISTSLFTVFFIAKFLSSEEQGYYYAFGSLVAVQIFFELGLTQIITQFVAHEASKLKFNSNYQLEGDSESKSRLSSLLRFCAKWYSIFALFLIGGLLIAGIVFFNKYGDNPDITWKLPWVLLVIGTAFNFLIAPIVSFLEGLNKVKEVAQMRLVQQFLHPLVVWGGLAVGSKLFVSGADAIIRVLVILIIVLKSPFYKILKNIWNDNGDVIISYKREVFPYQWRIALSWISGYFVFQLFNPILFAKEGAVVAGQMGMTMAALGGIQTLTLSWINTKVPRISSHIARKEYCELDSLFSRTMLQMLCIATAGIALFVAGVYIFQHYELSFLGMKIGDRFLPIIPLSCMALSTLTMIPVNCWATYLRCHKKEPLLVNSVVMGVLCALSAFILGDIYGLYGMTIGYLILRIISLVWISLVFKNKKAEWHYEN